MLDGSDRTKHYLLSLSTKSSRNGITKSSKRISSKVGFCILATNLGTKEMEQENQPLESLALNDRQCHRLSWLRSGSRENIALESDVCLTIVSKDYKEDESHFEVL